MVWSWLDVLKAVVILDTRTYLRETESILICFTVLMAFFQTFCDVDDIDSVIVVCLDHFVRASFIYQKFRTQQTKLEISKSYYFLQKNVSQPTVSVEVEKNFADPCKTLKKKNEKSLL